MWSHKSSNFLQIFLVYHKVHDADGTFILRETSTPTVPTLGMYGTGTVPYRLSAGMGPGTGTAILGFNILLDVSQSWMGIKVCWMHILMGRWASHQQSLN